MNRRRYLSLTTGSAISSVCGCLSSSESESNVQLAGVIVENYSDTRKTVEVRVSNGDSELESSEFELESGEHGDDWVLPYGESLSCEWTSEPKQFIVEARRDDDWKTVDVGERAETDCAVAYVRIDTPGYPGLTLRVSDCNDLNMEHELMCPFVESGR